MILILLQYTESKKNNEMKFKVLLKIDIYSSKMIYSEFLKYLENYIKSELQVMKAGS